MRAQGDPIMHDESSKALDSRLLRLHSQPDLTPSCWALQKI